VVCFPQQLPILLLLASIEVHAISWNMAGTRNKMENDFMKSTNDPREFEGKGRVAKRYRDEFLVGFFTASCSKGAGVGASLSGGFHTLADSLRCSLELRLAFQNGTTSVPA